MRKSFIFNFMELCFTEVLTLSPNSKDPYSLDIFNKISNF